MTSDDVRGVCLRRLQRRLKVRSRYPGSRGKNYIGPISRRGVPSLKIDTFLSET
jgi:hypothetical protein